MLSKKQFVIFATSVVILAMVLLQKERALAPADSDLIEMTDQFSAEENQELKDHQHDSIDQPKDSGLAFIQDKDSPNHDSEKHDSGQPHDCFESIRLGSQGLLPEVQLSDDQLAQIKETEMAMEEKMRAEFDEFIISDDGQTVFDKKSITEDFEREVRLAEQVQQGEVETTSVDEL